MLQAEGSFLLRADRVPPATREVDPRVVGPQLGHVPGVRHHLRGDPHVRRNIHAVDEIRVTNRLQIQYMGMS